MSVYNTSLISDTITNCLKRGYKVLTFGVGGNAANAIHFAAELQGKYEKFETPLPCIDLCSNASVVSAIATDFGWEHVFERQIKALANPEDVVLAFSIGTKGLYLVNAINAAIEQECKTILICGNYTTIQYFRGTGTVDKDENFTLLDLGSSDTPKVQEIQLKLIHQICGEVKSKF